MTYVPPGRVRMTHPDIPDGESFPTERAFRARWEPKGWVADQDVDEETDDLPEEDE